MVKYKYVSHLKKPLKAAADKCRAGFYILIPEVKPWPQVPVAFPPRRSADRLKHKSLLIAHSLRHLRSSVPDPKLLESRAGAEMDGDTGGGGGGHLDHEADEVFSLLSESHGQSTRQLKCFWRGCVHGVCVCVCVWVRPHVMRNSWSIKEMDEVGPSSGPSHPPAEC